MGEKKKLLILVDWFTPGYKAGGPIQSCVNLCIALQNLYEIYVLTTDTDHGEKDPYPGIKADEWIRNEDLGVQVYYANKKKLTLAQLFSEIKKLDADLIYLNHLFSPRFVVYPLWLALTGKIRNKVVVCPRGALYDSALSLKAYKKKPLLLLYKKMNIQKRVTFHATNERERDAIEKYFPGSSIVVADNLPNSRQRPFESCEKKAGSLKIIYVARIVAIKNLLFVLRVLKQVQENVLLTIVGPVEDADYWSSCQAAIQELPSNIEVKYEGPVENHYLQEKMREHHLYMLPTTGENFGHSVFEALLAGRPVLISDQTPWLGLQQHNAGWDLPLAAPDQFAAVIKLMAGLSQQQFDGYAKAAWRYAYDFINRPAATQPYQLLFS